MKVLVSGSSGLVGSALVRALADAGDYVTRLVRSEPRSSSEIRWDLEKGQVNGSLEGFDGVVHLAGETVVGRWTAAKKKRILESRVKGTHLLSKSLASLSKPPRVLVCASATGFYGSRGDEVLTERSSSGSAFLAEVCRRWEEAGQPAAQAGIRVVSLRFGVILSREGGALAKMLVPFRLGLGGIVGAGRQWMSWIALEDAVGAILHALKNDELRGPVNVVSPTPLRNHDFTKTLGRVLSRPTVMPLPAFAARLIFGEMANETLLNSTRVEPEVLKMSGYRFKSPQLEGALRSILSR